MTPRSFRLKIALLAGLMTTTLLVGSGLFLWQLTYRFNLDRLDRELRNIGQQNLERVVGPEHWVRLEKALQFVSGGAERPAYVLWVRNYDRVDYRSPGWPAAFPPESFPELTVYDGPGGPRPGEPPPPPPRPGEEISRRNPALPRKVPQFFSRTADGRTWRIGVMGTPYTTLLLAADFGAFNADMARLRNACLAGLPVVLLLAAGGAWFLAGRAMRPVEVLTCAVEGITARGLDQRMTVPGHDREFARLVAVFNSMMDRLENSFHQATRFSADASHELRTPLARLQAELEQALQHAPPGSPQQEVFVSLLDEVHRLAGIVGKLLLLSRVDSGRLQLARETIDLSEILASVVEDWQAQAPALTMENDLAPGVRVEGDANLLEQALQNLASNAVKYNRPGGRVRFELRRMATHAVVRISNTGPGIAPADRERIFERFFRGDPSRGRTDGVGLGLSLSREIVRAQGGDIVLLPVTGQGSDEVTVFEVRLLLVGSGGEEAPAV
jgi:two-component system, OmpR family, heavy metal sensor histidine kinase CusS